MKQTIYSLIIFLVTITLMHTFFVIGCKVIDVKPDPIIFLTDLFIGVFAVGYYNVERD